MELQATPKFAGRGVCPFTSSNTFKGTAHTEARVLKGVGGCGEGEERSAEARRRSSIRHSGPATTPRPARDRRPASPPAKLTSRRFGSSLSVYPARDSSPKLRRVRPVKGRTGGVLRPRTASRVRLRLGGQAPSSPVPAAACRGRGATTARPGRRPRSRDTGRRGPTGRRRRRTRSRWGNAWP